LKSKDDNLRITFKDEPIEVERGCQRDSKLGC
jgi:hypothetical protein